MKYERERRLTLDIAVLSHDSAVYVIEKYLIKPGFRIGRISAYMYYGYLKSLDWGKRWEQREVSYTAIYGTEQECVIQEYDIEEPSGHEPVLIKQGLLFEDPATGKGYEEIYV
jgi:hypothetical protein